MEQRRFCRMPAENLVLVFTGRQGVLSQLKPMFAIFLHLLLAHWCLPGSKISTSSWSAETEAPLLLGWAVLLLSLLRAAAASACGAGARWGMTPDFGTLIPVLQELSQLEAVSCASLAVAIYNGRMSLFYKVGQLDGIQRIKVLLSPQHFQGLLLLCCLLWRNWALAVLPASI